MAATKRNRLNTWWVSGYGKKILLLRHGELRRETDEKRFIGQTNIPLSNQGRCQAKYWRKRLTDLSIERVVSSDLCRCTETARILCANRPLVIHRLADLREIDLGQWDGMSFGRVRQRWPDAFRHRKMEMARFRPPGGESFVDLQQRVVPVFEAAVERAARNLMIVAHAGVNRMILCHLLGMPPQNLLRIAQGYGAMNLIDRQANGYRIQAINLCPAQSGVD